MLVRLSRSVLRVALKREPVGLDMRGSIVLMRLAAVNQRTVLGAADMLDKEHMAAARPLQHEREQGRQDTSSPNHSELEQKSLRGRHVWTASMSQPARRSIWRPCALEPLTPWGAARKPM